LIGKVYLENRDCKDAVQLGHFFSEMDRSMLSDGTAVPELVFQWGHFFSEMDSSQLSAKGMIKTSGLNWATSFQKWIELKSVAFANLGPMVSMGPLLFRNG
jgi:hypothetical protein